MSELELGRIKKMITSIYKLKFGYFAQCYKGRGSIITILMSSTIVCSI